jgi:hypothetical protein
MCTVLAANVTPSVIARAIKIFHFLMLFTAKSERELSAKSIVSFDFSHTI